MTRVLFLFGLLLPSICFSATPREVTTCGAFKERFMFALWSSAAGPPNPERVAGKLGVKEYEFEAGDGRLLRGYVVQSPEPSVESTITVVLLGNAMLADQVVGDFDRFLSAGSDVLILDYRGYGRSEGVRRLKAMVLDYQEAFDKLSSSYARLRIYAMSFGGVIAGNSLHRLEIKRSNIKLVIDAAPSFLSKDGCPEEYDLVRNLDLRIPTLVVYGTEDTVVGAARTRDLVDLAAKQGVDVYRCEGCEHPMMGPREEWNRRIDKAADFLFGKTNG